MPWYEIRIEPDDDGTFLVTVPAFPEITTFADTPDEASVIAPAAVEEAIAARMADGEDVPLPAAVADLVKLEHAAELTLLAYVKVTLYMLARREGITRAELARRLNWKREQVDRLFRLEHNSQLGQLDAAFKAIGHPLQFSTMSKVA